MHTDLFAADLAGDELPDTVRGDHNDAVVASKLPRQKLRRGYHAEPLRHGVAEAVAQ